MLDQGRTLRAADGGKIVVAGLLGFGSRGAVYRVATDGGDRALKWYYPDLGDRRQRQVIDNLVARGSDDRRFLWPQTTVTDPENPEAGFGYLMKVRPKRFRDLPALFRREMRITRRALVVIALHTAEAYRDLHSLGLAHHDVHWGTLFFDPANGDVLICDNDNTVPEGQSTAAARTVDFMAPELVRGDAGAAPGEQSDRHSLAVLLFMVLMNHHPLEGAAALRIKCMDDAAKMRLFGREPLFVFDPQNPANRPVPGEQDTVVETWEALPPTLRKLFVRAFTVGLHDATARVRETEWSTALSRVFDAVIQCGSCGRENLAEPDRSAVAQACSKCRGKLPLPPSLEITAGTGRHRAVRSIRLGPGAKVFQHHLVFSPEQHDFRAVVGEVAEHPQQPGRLGLRNRSQDTWTAYPDGGEVQQVPPGRSAALRPGLLIEFGGGSEAAYRGA